MVRLCQDSLATILVCSDLGLSVDIKKIYKPYTLAQWNKLADSILNSTLQKPSSLLHADSAMLKKELFLDREGIERLEFLLSRAGNIAIELESLESKGINITTRAESNYPQRLKKILKKQSPPIIFYSGNLDLANSDGIAIVGSRNIDENGVTFTRKLASKSSSEGFTIISGGAKGVDSIAENTSLENNGNVVSIVSDSLSRKINERNTRNAILDGKLLVFSTVSPDARFSVYSAMDRNKYVYALSKYTVVVSSKENGGGTWTGAVENLKKNWVPLFVRSEKNAPTGNKKLIELGGKPIGIDTLENDETTLSNFFEDKLNIKNKPKDFEQMNLYNMDIKKDNLTLKVMEIAENKKLQVQESIDLYKIVLPYIKRVLSEPKNQEELSGLLNVNKSQISVWINRAIEEDQVIKLKDPVRYLALEEQS